MLDAARFADANDFEAIRTPERHFGQFGGLYPNPSVLGAAIATATKRIQIRAGSVVLPLHDPLRVAEEWAVVDNLSGGRTALAIASGWHMDDFTLFPDRYSARKEYCVAAIEQLRSLWQGQSIQRKSADGGTIEVRVFPRPIQKSIPLWLTASAAEETFVAAGELGINLLTGLTGQSIEELGSKIKSYRAAFESAGHASKSGQVTLMLHTFIGEDLRKVKEQVRDPIYRYLRENLELHARLYRRHSKKRACLSSADEDALLKHSFGRYFRSGSLLGTALSCAPVLDQLEAIGVDEIACLVDFGLEANEVLTGLDRLASLARDRRR